MSSCAWAWAWVRGAKGGDWKEREGKGRKGKAMGRVCSCI